MKVRRKLQQSSSSSLPSSLKRFAPRSRITSAKTTPTKTVLISLLTLCHVVGLTLCIGEFSSHSLYFVWLCECFFACSQNDRLGACVSSNSRVLTYVLKNDSSCINTNTFSDHQAHTNKCFKGCDFVVDILCIALVYLATTLYLACCLSFFLNKKPQFAQKPTLHIRGVVTMLDCFMTSGVCVLIFYFGMVERSNTLGIHSFCLCTWEMQDSFFITRCIEPEHCETIRMHTIDCTQLLRRYFLCLSNRLNEKRWNTVLAMGEI